MKNIFLLFGLLLAAKVSAQDIKKYALKGVVTYYFNANYGDRPDTGAKAYLLTEQQATAQGLTYDRVSHYQLLYAQYQLAGLLMKPEKRQTPDEKKLTVDMKELADTLNKRQFLMEMGEKIPFMTADGSGVFSKNVAPGTYYVFVKSAHRQNVSTAEVNGQIQMKKVEIKDDDVEIAIRFSLAGY